MIRFVPEKDKVIFDMLAPHPLQSWAWGEFRELLGTKVLRLGLYEDHRLKETALITLHPIPFTKWTIGYLPKNLIPSEEMTEGLKNIGRENGCIFIKLEPNVINESGIKNYELGKRFRPSPHPLFTRYTFQLDITKSEEELLANMHNKTRYNIRVAQKHEVEVKEETSQDAFNDYLKLTFETTKRQHFYAHDKRYHRTMWDTMRKTGIAHLLTATYKDKRLVTWIVFLFNNVLYYPYGASSTSYRNVMASNLMMWEAIRWGKSHGAKLFDMWGALGPDPDPNDSWIGFHRFKQGYGARHVEFVGSFDLIIHPKLYKLYNFAYSLRHQFLNLRARLR